MRLGIALAVLLVSASAAAQTEPERAWSDFNEQNAALASATTQSSDSGAPHGTDCATACKALESLARAAQHLCDVAPEHCEEAKAKLRSATERVHAACPQCVVRAETAPPQTFSGEEASVVAVQSSRKSGGCAGCATSPSSDAGALALPLAALAALVRRRRR